MAGFQAYGEAHKWICGRPGAGICGCRGQAGCCDQEQEAQAEFAPIHAPGVRSLQSIQSVAGCSWSMCDLWQSLGL